MEVRVFAPASVGNVGVGFDVLGMAIERPGDEVVARFTDMPGLRIAAITGDGGLLPYDPEKNTAGVAALRLLEALGETQRGIELEVHKKMPFGSGLGSSAASAAAAAVAVDALLGAGLSRRALLPFAAQGEQVATGSNHPDNVAPSLMGGIVLIHDKDTLDVCELPVPEGLCAVVVHPNVEVLTKNARAILRPEVPLQTYVRQSAHVAAFVAALYRADLDMLGRALQDEIIEPQRAVLIPGFYAVKKAALDAGALGCSISGSGPSVFALCAGLDTAQRIGQAMQTAFAGAGLESTVYASAVNREGARIDRK